jgi:septum site-determining protein MinC
MTADLARKEDNTSTPVEFRGSVFTLMVLSLGDPRDPTFFSRLADKIAQAPNFFRNAAVVVDLKSFPEDQPLNLAEVGRRLRQHQLTPIGIQNGNEEQNRQALNAGFAVMSAGQSARPEPRTSAPEPAEKEPDAPAEVTNTGNEDEVTALSGETYPERDTDQTLTITQPVRSGQQIYACRRDLVVLSSVGAGAELLADGHIHVYGTLRGRAVAGVSGDLSARIFCRSLEAELISVSGYWLVRDDIPEDLIGKPVQIFLGDGERVEVAPLP